MSRIMFTLAVVLVSSLIASAASALPSRPREPGKHVDSIVTVPGQPHHTAEQISELETKVGAFPTRSILEIYQAGAPADQMPAFVDSLLQKWHREQPQLYDPEKDCVAVLSYFPTTVVFRGPPGLTKDYQQVYNGLYGDPLARTVATLSQMSHDMAMLQKLQQEQKAAKAAAEVQAKREMIERNVAEAKERKVIIDLARSQAKALEALRDATQQCTPEQSALLEEFLANARKPAESQNLLELMELTVGLTNTLDLIQDKVLQQQANQRRQWYFIIGVIAVGIVLIYIARRLQRRRRADLRELGKAEAQIKAELRKLPSEQKLKEYRQKHGVTQQEFGAVNVKITTCLGLLKTAADSIPPLKRLRKIPQESIAAIHDHIIEVVRPEVQDAVKAWTDFCRDMNHAEQVNLRHAVVDPRQGLRETFSHNTHLQLLMNRLPELRLDETFQRWAELRKNDQLGFVKELEAKKAELRLIREQVVELGQLYEQALRLSYKPGYVDDLMEQLVGDPRRSLGNILTVMRATVAFKDYSKI